MARKFEIQLKQWFPLVIDCYFTYDSLNTLEIIKHSGGALRILGVEGHVQEILDVLGFLVQAGFLIPKDKSRPEHFGVVFDSYIYDISDKFKELLDESQHRAEQPKANDWIENIKVENTNHNNVNIYNFNLTFALDKLIEVKAGLLNL